MKNATCYCCTASRDASTYSHALESKAKSTSIEKAMESLLKMHIHKRTLPSPAIQSTNKTATRGVSTVKELTKLGGKADLKNDQKTPPEDAGQRKKRICSNERSLRTSKKWISESLYLLFGHVCMRPLLLRAWSVKNAGQWDMILADQCNDIIIKYWESNCWYTGMLPAIRSVKARS